MSSFTMPAQLEMLDDYKWRLISQFEYHIGNYPSERIISVHAGYVTDLASVPRIFWSIFPPNGRYAKAAIIHDYLYSNAIGTKKEADLIFLEAMQVLKVPYFTRHIIYLAVHFFGRGRWSTH